MDIPSSFLISFEGFSPYHETQTVVFWFLSTQCITQHLKIRIRIEP